MCNDVAKSFDRTHVRSILVRSNPCPKIPSGMGTQTVPKSEGVRGENPKRASCLTDVRATSITPERD
jgi:hypothetical protein